MKFDIAMEYLYRKHDHGLSVGLFMKYGDAGVLEFLWGILKYMNMNWIIQWESGFGLFVLHVLYIDAVLVSNATADL